MAIKIWPTVKLNTVGSRIVHEFIERHYAKVGEIYVTAGTDGVHAKGSYHYGRIYNGSVAAAIDFGFLDGVATNIGDVRGRDFAKWLYDYFGGNTIELIHSTPFANDRGFYVKNGVRMPGGGVYDLATRNAHRNHVHLALSAHQLDLIAAAYKKLTPVPKPVVPKAPAVPSVPPAVVPPVTTPAPVVIVPPDVPLVPVGLTVEQRLDRLEAAVFPDRGVTFATGGVIDPTNEVGGTA